MVVTQIKNSQQNLTDYTENKLLIPILAGIIDWFAMRLFLVMNSLSTGEIFALLFFTCKHKISFAHMPAQIGFNF